MYTDVSYVMNTIRFFGYFIRLVTLLIITVELSWLVYLALLINSHSLMSDGQGAGQCDEGLKCPRLEYTGFRTIRSTRLGDQQVVTLSPIKAVDSNKILNNIDNNYNAQRGPSITRLCLYMMALRQRSQNDATYMYVSLRKNCCPSHSSRSWK